MVQRVGDRLPAIQAGFWIRRSHAYVFAPQNQIHVASPADVLRAQVGTVVVRREAPDSEIVEKLSHLLGLTLGPLEVGRIEFDTLVFHLRDGAPRALQIFFTFVADRKESQAGRNRFRRAS